MRHLLYIVAIAVVVLFSIDLIIPNSNPSLIFEGNSESFNLNGHSANANFKTDIVYFMSNISVFRSVKNISIKDKYGNITFINSSNVEVFYNKNVYEMLLYGHTDLYIDDFTIIRPDINRIQIDGNLNQNRNSVLKSDACTVTITNNDANSVLIEGNEFKNFIVISFELDNTSHIQLIPGTIKIDAYGISEAKINGELSNEFALDMSEGKLRLDDQSFNVINTDAIDISINSNYPASFEVEDAKMSLKATVDSVIMNENNIIMSKIFYWFNQQTEKINAFATVILVLVTAKYAYDNNKMVRQNSNIQKIALIERKLEKYYFPVLSFFDLCETDEHFNCNENDPPHKINYESTNLKTFNDVFKYQYLASPNLKAKMTEFVVMLHNQFSNEEDKELYLLFHELDDENSEILTIKNKFDIILFTEVRKLVLEEIIKLEQELNELIR